MNLAVSNNPCCADFDLVHTSAADNVMVATTRVIDQAHMVLPNPPKTIGAQLIAFTLLAGLIPLVEVGALSAQSPQPHWTYPALIYVAITVYAGARLAMFLDPARPQYLGIVFFVFVYVWMGLASVAQTASQTWPFGITLSEGIQLQGALLIAGGVIMFDAGRLLRRQLRRQLHRERQVIVPAKVRRLSSSRVILLCWIVIITSPLAVFMLGGLTAQFQNRLAAFAALYPGGVINGVVQQQILFGALARDGWTVLAFVALYALLLVMRERRTAKLPARTSHVILLLCVCGVNVVINSPFANARFWMGTIVIALLLSRRFFLTWPGKAVFLTAILIGTAVIFPYGNVFRTANYQIPPGYGVVSAFETDPDYDASFEVAATVQYTQLNGLSVGQQLLGDVAFWVPRQLWPGKPTDTGYIIGYFLNTPTPNVSAPLWAEGFIDFGWLGGAAYLLFAGYASGALDGAWGRGVGPLDFSRLLLPLLAGYSVILLRGSLLQAMAQLTAFCLLIWLICTYSGGIRSPVSAESRSEGSELRSPVTGRRNGSLK